MAHNRYHFVTRWLVDGSPDEVAAVFRDTSSLGTWFPAVFLDATVLAQGGRDDVGKVAAVRVKGWMPHTLRFTFRVREVRYPCEFTLDVWGDFNGQLVCRAAPHQDRLALYFDWRVQVTKPFVRYMSLPLRPFFVSNHLWVVARGEESLNIELRRRRDACLARETPRPPEPTFPHGPLGAYIRSRVWSLASLHSPRSFPA